MPQEARERRGGEFHGVSGNLVKNVLTSEGYLSPYYLGYVGFHVLYIAR